MTDWKEKVDAAYDIVHALCQPRGSEGSRQWIMSIPARPDCDPDLVITSGLRSATKEIHALAAECDRLAAENAELQYWKQGNIRCAKALTAANATLDKLREVVNPDGAVLTANQVCDKYFAMQDILYPKETPND